MSAPPRTFVLQSIVGSRRVDADRSRCAVRPGWLLLVAGLTAFVLVLTVSNQIFDTNYSALWEATALLAGDHPYRDFYEWGAPLTGVLSTVAQFLAGYRLIGEFGLQWLCIVTGAVVSFHLGFHLSRSLTASLVTLLLSLVVLIGTPTYHYPKLLVYPLALLLAWRYLDRPSPGRGAMLGLMTTMAFLFRHDHGVHVACLAALALIVARLVRRSSRSLRALFVEGTSYGAAAVLALVPWLIVVQQGEGLPEYLRQRAALYENWSGKDSPFQVLLTMNPAQALGGFDWDSVGGPRLLLPTEVNAVAWLRQVTLLVPILLMASVATDVLRSWHRKESVSANTWHVVLAAALLAIVDEALLREPSYFVVIAPLTAAMGAGLLALDGATVEATPGVSRSGWLAHTWTALRAALGVGIVLVTSVAALVFTQIIVQPLELFSAVRPAFARLLASPPIEGVWPAREVPGYTREAWDRGEGDKEAVMLRYSTTAPRPETACW